MNMLCIDKLTIAYLKKRLNVLNREHSSGPQACPPMNGGMLLLLFTRPLPRDGGMAEDHGAPEAGQFPRVWTRGHKETESRQRVRSWTVQNEMRDVLGRVSTGAARILDSANPGEIKI